MRYFPAFHDLTARRSLVMGGGEQAGRKLRLLLKAGARPLVVAPHVAAEIAGLAEAGSLTGQSSPFRLDAMAGYATGLSSPSLAGMGHGLAGAAMGASATANAAERRASYT